MQRFKIETFGDDTGHMRAAGVAFGRDRMGDVVLEIGFWTVLLIVVLKKGDRRDG